MVQLSFEIKKKPHSHSRFGGTAFRWFLIMFVLCLGRSVRHGFNHITGEAPEPFLSLIHEQVGFPPLVNLSDIVPDEGHVVRLERRAAQIHLRFMRKPVAFLVVAFHTCTHHVLPGIIPALRLRMDMVDGQGEIRPSAILTPVVIAAQYVLSRQNDLLVRNMDIDTQPDNARERQRSRNRVDPLVVAFLYDFRLPEIQQYDGLSDITHAHRFIVLVQHQDFRVEPAACTSFT